MHVNVWIELEFEHKDKYRDAVSGPIAVGRIHDPQDLLWLLANKGLVDHGQLVDTMRELQGEWPVALKELEERCRLKT